nr:unnamed protein product [Callosobruchus chinensis]CAH7768932.1 unnamed protein product [Callosobruchus chinensis]
MTRPQRAISSRFLTGVL